MANNILLIETTVPNDFDDRNTVSYSKAQISMGSIPEERLQQVYEILLSYQNRLSVGQNKRVTIHLDGKEIIKFYGQNDLSLYIQHIQDRIYIYKFVSEMEEDLPKMNNKNKIVYFVKNKVEKLLEAVVLNMKKEGN